MKSHWHMHQRIAGLLVSVRLCVVKYHPNLGLLRLVYDAGQLNCPIVSTKHAVG